MKNITDAELKILKVLWIKSPVSATEVIDNIKFHFGSTWNASTIKTLLARLCKKEIVTIDYSARPLLYKPLVTQENYQRHACRSLLNEFFNGTAMDMFSFLIRSDELTPDEINELRQLLHSRKGRK